MGNGSVSAVQIQIFQNFGTDGDSNGGFQSGSILRFPFAVAAHIKSGLDAVSIIAEIPGGFRILDGGTLPVYETGFAKLDFTFGAGPSHQSREPGIVRHGERVEVLVGVSIHRKMNPELFLIVEAAGRLRHDPGFVQRRKKHSGKDCYDRNDDKEFYKSEI